MAFSPACFIVLEPYGDIMNSGGTTGAYPPLFIINGAGIFTDKLSNFFGERRLGGGEKDFSEF